MVLLDNLMNLGQFAQSCLGLCSFFFISYLFSTSRSSIVWSQTLRIFLIGICLAYFFINYSVGLVFLNSISFGFEKLFAFAEEGISFIFGSLGSVREPWGFIFAFRVLPLTIFFSALVAILNYFGLIRFTFSIINKLFIPLFGTRKAETLCATANSFLGQTEAPLLIKDKLANMNDSEIFSVMVAGMSTLSASLLAVYSSIGISTSHLLTSAILSVPFSLMISKIWHPDDYTFNSDQQQSTESSEEKESFMESMSGGAISGLSIALNVAAILLVIVSFMAFLDAGIDWIVRLIANCYNFFTHSQVAWSINLKDIFGYLCMPFAWLIGISPNEVFEAGRLLGAKVAVNEMVAYSWLTKSMLSIRAKTILTYALAGFSNFSSIGLQVAGIGVLAPVIKPKLSNFGVRAVIAAFLVNVMSASVISLFV